MSIISFFSNLMGSFSGPEVQSQFVPCKVSLDKGETERCYLEVDVTSHGAPLFSYEDLPDNIAASRDITIECFVDGRAWTVKFVNGELAESEFDKYPGINYRRKIFGTHEYPKEDIDGLPELV